MAHHEQQVNAIKRENEAGMRERVTALGTGVLSWPLIYAPGQPAEMGSSENTPTKNNNIKY